jgi:opacity protein-like surface antigen
MRNLILVAVLSFIFSVNSFCQDYANIYIGAGLSFPERPINFSSFYNMGYNVGGGIGFPLSPSLAIVGDFSYNTFQFDQSNFHTELGFNSMRVTPANTSISMSTITANIKFTFNQRPRAAIAYIIVGIGYVDISASKSTISGPEYFAFASGSSKADFYAQAGSGVAFPLTRTTRIFLEAKFADAFTSGSITTFVPIRAGFIVRI